MTYGCHDRREYKDKLIVQDGWWLDGQSRAAKMFQIPFAMSRQCQYTKTDLGKADHRCHGCRWRDGLDTPQKV